MDGISAESAFVLILLMNVVAMLMIVYASYRGGKTDTKE